jgi:1-acyl-sn-glycerol-3-phosphate acyltransferase
MKKSTRIRLRSGLYFAWFLVISVAMHIVALPTLLMPRKAIVWMAQSWSAALIWGLKVFVGLRFEIRGAMPENGVLVASKHMSMWDTLALYMLLNDPIVVIKRELKSIPFYGWFAAKADMIFVDRKGHAGALRKMTAHAAKAMAQGRSLIIFPEGTRKKPDDPPDYKSGIAGLYTRLGCPCVPVALNSGLFWTGRGGYIKKPGKIVLEFLPPIPAGLPRPEFMQTLEGRIEEATRRLVGEGRAILASRDEPAKTE